VIQLTTRRKNTDLVALNDDPTSDVSAFSKVLEVVRDGKLYASHSPISRPFT
jgi:imidazolonepropionase-like amidohydrolase